MAVIGNDLSAAVCEVDRRRLTVALAALVAAAAVPSASVLALDRMLGPRELAGTWRGREASPVGVMTVHVTFFPNGTYRRTHRLGELMTFDVGSYSIVQNWIHFKLDEYGPRFYRGRRLTQPMSDTWVVDHFDGRSLQATVGGTSRVTMQRM